jgi:hypothetical protein
MSIWVWSIWNGGYKLWIYDQKSYDILWPSCLRTFARLWFKKDSTEVTPAFFCWLNLEGVPPPEVGAEEDVGNWATQRLPRCWALSPWQSEKHPLHFRIKYPSYSIWMDVSDVSTWHWHGLLQTVLNNVGLSVLQDSCVYFILMTEMFVR